MGMMPHHQIRSQVNGSVGQGLLCLIRLGTLLRAPVKCCYDNLGAGFFDSGDRPFQLRGFLHPGVQNIDANQPDFNAINLFYDNLVPVTISNPGFHQVLLCIDQTLGTIVTAVIVGQGNCFHRTVLQNSHIGRISLKSKLLVAPGVQRSKGSLEIGEGNIVPIQNRSHILKEIAVPVHRLYRIKAVHGAKVNVSTQRTIAQCGYGHFGFRFHLNFAAHGGEFVR